MIKFLLGVAIVGFTSYCGYLLAKKYRQKKMFFSQFREFNERFLSEISYARRPIEEFVSKYAYNGEFEVLLNDYFSGIKERSAEERSMTDLPIYSFLSKEEKVFTEDYFLMLGKGDSASQKGYFSSVKDTLNKMQFEAETSCKKYGDLYIKIGFLCGLLILILII